MKRKFLLFCLLSFGYVSGQPFTPQQLAIINAENSFAGLSRSTNTVNAFLAYLSDSTVLVANNRPVIGKQGWLERKPDSSLLFWWPVFVGVSKDGALGFSTGPWEWSKSRNEARPQAYGYYATVWKKENDGSWKMAVDLGISFPEENKSNPPLKISSTPIDNTTVTTATELAGIDKSYIAQLNNRSVSFLHDHFTNDGHLLRNGHKVYENLLNVDPAIEKGIRFSFKYAGGGIATSQDLGYAYGTVEITSIKDGSNVTENKCYLHVWKRINDQWKIVLDVIAGS